MLAGMDIDGRLYSRSNTGFFRIRSSHDMIATNESQTHTPFLCHKETVWFDIPRPNNETTFSAHPLRFKRDEPRPDQLLEKVVIPPTEGKKLQ